MSTRSFRQQAGFACENCRQRKVRCDRGRPKCNLCIELGMPCVVIDQRPQRGPKKGQLDEMRKRIAGLERQLSQQLRNQQLGHGDEANFDFGSKAALPDSIPPPGPAQTPPAVEIGFGCTAVGLVSGGAFEKPTTALSQYRRSGSAPMTPAPSTEHSHSVLSSPLSLPGDAVVAAVVDTAAACQNGPPEFPALMDWSDMELGHDGNLLASLNEAFQFDLDPRAQAFQTNQTGHTSQASCTGQSPMRVCGGFRMNSLVLADLDQLYFDRVHPVLPILHRQRYFSWAAQPQLPPAHACLRSAMHTVAAAMSAQYRNLGDALYRETCRLLEGQRPGSSQPAYSDTCFSWFASVAAAARAQPSPPAISDIPLELVQAWLLLAHYESMCVDERHALLTAGRAFRLVQLARLFEVDAVVIGDDNMAEEKRRTFWLAFLMDRLLCARNAWPLTLHEEAVQTRLPVSEVLFQSGQPGRGCFLRDVLAAAENPTSPSAAEFAGLSPFAECIVVAALNDRCALHRRTSWGSGEISKETLNPQAGTSPADAQFWAHHDILATTVQERVLKLAQAVPSNGSQASARGHTPSRSASLLYSDPMVLFTRMLAHRAVISLCGVLEAVPRLAEEKEKGQFYRWRAEKSAAEMVLLAEAARPLGCFGAHPFMADPLAYAVGFLVRQKAGDSNTSDDMNKHDNGSGIESLMGVLRNLQNVNVLAWEYVQTLEREYNVLRKLEHTSRQ